MAQRERIRELEVLLQREQMSSNVEPKQGTNRRRRYRGKWRGSNGTSKDSILNPTEQREPRVTAPGQTFGGLPAPPSFEIREVVSPQEIIQ